ncbi:MAG: efflux RND transporter periplasmic adaptor subunit [Mucilaginibacter sp.]
MTLQNKSKAALYLSVLLVPCFFLFTGCGKRAATAKAVIMPITESVYASGKIKTDNQYQAFAAQGGIVRDVYVTEGDAVTTGTPLLSIISDEQRLRQQNAALEAQYADINANQDKLDNAAQQIQLARDRVRNDSALYFRQKALWEQQVGTRIDFEQRELNYRDAQTALNTAMVNYRQLKRQLELASGQSRHNLAIARKQESDFVVTSKLNGTVYRIYPKKGEQVAPQTPVALLGASGKFLVDLAVDEDDIAKVVRGQKVLVSMDSYPGQVFEAAVSKIYPVTDERSRTVEVEATFLHPPARLYPNMSLEANIVISTRARALVIPRTCLINDSFVVRAGKDTVKVKTGLKDYQMVEILSGLKQGDELVKP